MLIVIGHKNPDTDTVVSAEMFSRFLKDEGKNAQSAIPGEVNNETKFVFSRLEEKIPRIVTEKEKNEGEFFLVDHNDMRQSVAKKENVWGILDHHLLSGLRTDSPIYCRIEPLGSTCTLIYKMMKDRGMNPDKKEAALLLSGIISDTLNLNSATTTSEDIDLYYELVDIAGIDPEDFAKGMFEAKSDFSGMEMKDIIRGDLKEYEFGGKKVGIGVAETTSLKFFKENENDVVENIVKVKKEEGFDALFFGVVDIINQDTYLYPAEEEEVESIKKVFKGRREGKFFLLKGTSSRKKEIAPPLSEYYGT